MPSLTLGELIRKARKDAGLEQTELATICGVSRPLVSRWENDRSVPDVEQYRRIIAATKAAWLIEHLTAA